MIINLQNIEEIIFFDKKIQSLFPEFRHLFDQWQLGKRVSEMSNLGQRSIIELLNSLEEKQILKLREYFGDIIIIDKINHKIVEFYDFNLEDENVLCKYTGYRDFCLHRDKDTVNVSLWR